MNDEFTQEQKEWQQIRRGRWVLVSTWVGTSCWVGRGWLCWRHASGSDHRTRYRGCCWEHMQDVQVLGGMGLRHEHVRPLVADYDTRPPPRLFHPAVGMLSSTLCTTVAPIAQPWKLSGRSLALFPPHSRHSCPPPPPSTGMLSSNVVHTTVAPIEPPDDCLRDRFINLAHPIIALLLYCPHPAVGMLSSTLCTTVVPPSA